jgi:single-stranded DNA-binding protein
MNAYIITNARIVAPPVTKQFNGKDYAELRVADNPLKRTDHKGNPRKGRFVTLKLWGHLAKLAAKLSKGDIIVASGELEIESWKDREGNERDKDVMACQSFVVSKSESFYGRGEAPAQDDAPAGDAGLPF